MFSHIKLKNRLVNQPSSEIRDEQTSASSGKKKRSLLHEFDILLRRISNIREWSKTLIRDSVALVSTDMDIKSYLNDYEKKHLGKTKLENLGTDMINAAKKGGGVEGGSYEKALLKVGECERRLGTYERDFVVDVCSSFIRPLKYFMEVELNKLLEEKDILTSRKIDYDYYLKQASSGRVDKITYHKLKLAETALEVQFIHAKKILHGQVSECQVGHLIDLVNVQSVYHQKCLNELEKLKSELKRMSANALTKETNLHLLIDTPVYTPSSRPRKRVGEVNPSDMRPSCLKRLETYSTIEETQIPGSRMSQERFQNTSRRTPEKLLTDSGEVESKDVSGKKCVCGGSKICPDLNKRSGLQPNNTHEVKCARKTRSSILPSVESKRTRHEKIPEDPRARPDVVSPQECSKHQVNTHSARKPSLKSSVNPPSRNHYSGDLSGGTNVDKLDYSSNDSTNSKETHIISIPVRSDYRRDVGKMFFTPCKDLE